MCERDTEDGLMKPKDNLDLVGAPCRKCKVAKATVVLQGKFPYCRNCFLPYFTHKFSATLGKSKLMKHGDKILLAFSGSSSSMCLLDLVKNSMDESRRKKISTSAVIMYIDEGPVFGKSQEERTEILNEIYNSVLLYNFKTYCTSYDGFFSDDVVLYTSPSSILKEPNPNRLSCVLEKCESQTAKIDLLAKARNDVLVKSAKSLECNRIFLAETSDHLAVNVISNISLGRGAQLALDAGFCDDRHEGILILKPLQDCSKKEVTYYNTFNDLNSVILPSFGTMDDQFSSIQKLTENFIAELQSSFPSTVSTVVATGNKMVTNGKEEAATCSLCQAKIDTEDGDLSAEGATKLSSAVSNLGMKGFEADTLEPKQDSNEELHTESCKTTCSPSESGCNCKKDYSKISKDQLAGVLCYGCRLILKDCSNTEDWPSIIQMKAIEKTQHKEMENEIKDFLL